MGDELVILGLFVGFLSFVVAPIAVFLYFYLDKSCENDDDCDDDEICNFDSTTKSEEGECKKRTSIDGSGGGGGGGGGNSRSSRGVSCFYDLECTPTPAYCDGVDLTNLVEGECKSGAKPSNSVLQGFVQNEEEAVASRARDEEWWTQGYMSRSSSGYFGGNYINFIKRYACCNPEVADRGTYAQKVPEDDGSISCSGDLDGVPLGGKTCGYHLKFTPHTHWEDIDASVFE